MLQVLGAAIAAVFLAGVVKLWWITRLLKKQEVLDEEKKARVEEMRRTGIPPKRANDIPFGIRAIQSGVEVVGIWISRPDSPSHPAPSKAADPSITIINLDSEKGTESSDELKILPVTTTNNNTKNPPTPNPQPANDGTTQLAPTPPRSTPRQHGGGTNMLSEDTLRKLEGQSRQQQQQPYVRMSAPVPPPSHSHHHHHHHPRGPHHHLSQRSSESSASASGESMDSQPRSFRTASGRSYTDSSRTSSKLYMATTRNARGGGEGGTRAAYYSGLPLGGWQLEENYSSSNRGDPFGTPPHGRFSHQGEVMGREVVTPEPTFGPGDAVHVARVARRVNEGFEVLPGGTFAALRRLEEGGARGSATEGSEGVEGGRGQKKSRKKSIGSIQENGTGQVVG